MSTTSSPCVICDRAIEPERLEQTPNTLFCAEHARKRPCETCANEIEAERVRDFPETLYCAAHAPKGMACQICGRLIEYERREVVPESSLCQEHAAAVKKYGGEFRRRVKRVKLGKPGIAGGKSSDIETATELNKEAIARVREEYLKSQGYKAL
jgi:RNA polymerase-binding transcription factor DksA